MAQSAKGGRVPRRSAALAGAASAAARALAALVDVIVTAVAVTILGGIIFAVLEANRSNAIVTAFHDAASWLVGPFHGMFMLSRPLDQLAVNWGIALVVYVIAGRTIALGLRSHARPRA
jgi:hypothetical protein